MTTRRMNEMWRKMALAVVICILLFQSASCNGDDAISSGSTSTAVMNTAKTTSAEKSTQTITPNLTESVSMNSTDGTAGANLASATVTQPPSNKFFTPIHDVDDFLNRLKEPTVAPRILIHQDTKTLQQTVQCVEKDNLNDQQVVTFYLEASSSCEATRKAIESKIDDLCETSQCSVKIAQEENTNTVFMTGEGVPGDVARIHQWIDVNKEYRRMPVTPNNQDGKKTNAVFWSLLASGLVLAAGLIGAYVWKNRSRGDAKGMKLADESYMADEENQGNTLVSVAPLNPPESSEKPSQNGESPEAVKPQNPPTATNGHSGTKTADTEL